MFRGNIFDILVQILIHTSALKMDYYHLRNKGSAELPTSI